MSHASGAANFGWRSWVQIVGPITSMVIGLTCSLLAVYLVSPANIDPANPAQVLASLGAVPTLLLWLGQINILLALFNLVPGFPLDGGRVLRASLWGATGNLQKATRWASAVGQGFAWILLASGVAMMLGFRVPVFGTGFVGGLWISLIGWFLNNAAIAGYRQLLLRNSLEAVPVSKLMQTRFASASPHLPVVEQGQVQGLIQREDILSSGYPSIRTVMPRARHLRRDAADDRLSNAAIIRGAHPLGTHDSHRSRKNGANHAFLTFFL
jgi:Zn-dependent protease